MSTKYAINLLPEQKGKVADKLLYFILHYFRYIIVITQIVVISVFFYRFREDQKIIDLKESFKQKQQILLVTLPIIEEAEAIDAQTSRISDLLSEQKGTVEHFEFIIDVIPDQISLTSIDIGKDGMQLSGKSESILAIRALHKRIKQLEKYSMASIRVVQENQDGTYGFSIAVPIQQVQAEAQS